MHCQGSQHASLTTDPRPCAALLLVAQNTVLKTWKGEEGNVQAAQAALLKRAKANSDAQQGKYDPRCVAVAVSGGEVGGVECVRLD